MPACDADVLIVGGGVAGASAAYFAARAGRQVTLVDAGLHRASDLPLALVNPLRGRLGRLVRDGIEGARCTFALIDRLIEDGHRIAHGRGLWRPLIGAPQSLCARAFWEALLPGDFPFAWHDAAPASLGLVGAAPALWLADAGWAAPRELLAAAIASSRALVLANEVVAISSTLARTCGDASRIATLVDGNRIVARTILWCAGAWGASRLVRASGAARLGDGNALAYKPGSLVVTATPLTDAPLTFGTYAAPTCDDSVQGTVLGPTREPAAKNFAMPTPRDEAIARLVQRAQRAFRVTIEIRDAWHGVRLARVPSSLADALNGTRAITALGSRGFLMAPLWAAQWARSL